MYIRAFESQNDIRRVEKCIFGVQTSLDEGNVL